MGGAAGLSQRASIQNLNNLCDKHEGVVWPGVDWFLSIAHMSNAVVYAEFLYEITHLNNVMIQCLHVQGVALF